MSPFHMVLDGLRRQTDAVSEAAPAMRAASFDRTFAAQTDRPVHAPGAQTRFFADAEVSETPVDEMCSVEVTVARELQLSDDLAPVDLERIRRTFAYRNHPDRVDAAHKPRALERMTVANVLIDRALKAARSRLR